MKYYICANILMDDIEVEGTLDEAMSRADELASYTQENITIYKDNYRKTVVAFRAWCPLEEPEEDETDIIDYGTFGYYAEWNVIQEEL